MFWSKKKPRKPIKDPVAKYGEMIRNNKTRRKKYSKKPAMIDRIFPNGCDGDFVYYDE